MGVLSPHSHIRLVWLHHIYSQTTALYFWMCILYCASWRSCKPLKKGGGNKLRPLYINCFYALKTLRKCNLREKKLCLGRVTDINIHAQVAQVCLPIGFPVQSLFLPKYQTSVIFQNAGRIETTAESILSSKMKMIIHLWTKCISRAGAELCRQNNGRLFLSLNGDTYALASCFTS